MGVIRKHGGYIALNVVIILHLLNKGRRANMQYLKPKIVLKKAVTCAIAFSSLFCWGVSIGYGQSKHVTDSLYHVLNTTKYDTLKVNTLLVLAALSEDKSNYLKSDSFAREELKLSERIKYGTGIAYGHIYLGLNAYYQGNYAKAVEEYFGALNMLDKTGNKRGQAIALNNIGLSYNMMDDYKHALQYYSLGLKLKQEMGDKRGTASTLNNIGMVYLKQSMYDSALIYFNKSVAIKESYGDKRGVASTYNNIGDVYRDEGKYAQAMDIMQKALKIKEDFGDKYGIASSMTSIGDVYFKLGKLDEAIKMGLQAEKISNEIGALDEMQDAESFLSDVYEKKNGGSKALEHYKAYIKARDSIYNRQNTKKTVQAEMNFEFEKQQTEAKAAQDKKDAVQKEAARKQQLVIYFISGILLLVFVFALFAYRSYMQKQHANKELDEKNKKIEGAYKVIAEKNREITDSITYAKRIQRAMLPSKDEIKESFPHSFVLFKPKAIVSGDFYFYHKLPVTKEHEVRAVLAAVDCTGHGVPGAFMSMIGTEKLLDAVEEKSDTGEILKQLNTGIKTSLHQSSETNSTRDGMDIALCSFTHNGAGAVVQYSGANRPLWIIRKEKKEIEEIKPDKKAIGGFTGAEESFGAHTINLNTGDSVYLFSDGYIDQFGGPEGKKLSTKRFRELLLSLCDKSMNEQKKELSVFIERWREKTEQLDDILVIGVRI